MLNEEGVLRLIEAIYKTAIEDYVKAKRYMTRNYAVIPTKKEAVFKKDSKLSGYEFLYFDTLDFFKKDPYGLYPGNYTSDDIIKIIEKKYNL